MYNGALTWFVNMRKKIIIIILSLVLAFILFLIIEFVYISNNGTPVAAPDIPRQAQTLGSGPTLTYVVMGDSTSIGQGAQYKNSYAVASFHHLSQKYTVKFVNVGISGATAKSVLVEQLAKAQSYKPDLVLLAVGANDSTHLTSGKSIENSLQQIIDGLKKANPDVKIVTTRSPAMDSVTRFPIGAKQFMGLRYHQVNKAFAKIIAKNNLTLAPIAEKTRAAFIADPTLTASDNFHPNDRGYALWIPVVNGALDQALKN